MLIYGAPPVPAGQNNYRKGAFRVLGGLPSLSASTDLSDLYNAKFRNVSPGSKIALKLVGVSVSGKRSATLFFSGIIPNASSAADTGTDTGTKNGTLKLA